MSAAAKPEVAGTALTLPQRAAAALGTAKVEGQLRELAAKHTALTVITNEAGRADCHSARMELKNQRLAIEKLGKAAREDAQAFAKACIGEENRLVAIIEPEEKRLQGLQDAWDEKIAAEKTAKERAEQERVRKIAEALDDIGGMPLRYVGASVADLADALVRLREMTPEVWAQEFTDKAKETIQAAIAKVEQMHAAAVAAATQAQRQAEEAARLAVERAALERQQAEARAAEEAARKAREEVEAAHRLKLEQEARAARERAESEDRERRRKLDDEEAARRKALQEDEDRRRAAAKAEEDRLAAQRRELEEAQRRQRDEDEARERAAREAEEARQAAERDRRRAEQDAREEAERQARLHRTAVEDGHALLRNFCEEYGKLPEFQPIAGEIIEFLDEFEVPA